jgi:hypothetical protein
MSDLFQEKVSLSYIVRVLLLVPSVSRRSHPSMSHTPMDRWVSLRQPMIAGLAGAVS